MRMIETDDHGCLRVITLARPEKLNALTEDAVTDLRAALAAADHDTAVRAVALAGAGRAFCAGADIGLVDAYAQLARKPGGHACLRAKLEDWQALVLDIERMGTPVIAAVAGIAAGAGCEIALGCDLRISTRDSAFALPEVRLGLTTDMGASYRLAELTGGSLATAALLAGTPISAPDGLRHGLVHTLVAHAEQLWPAVEAWVRDIEAAPASAVAAGKRLRFSHREPALLAALERETETQLQLYSGDAVITAYQALQAARARQKSSKA